MAAAADRCQFWLPNKRRHCANIPVPSSQFCGNHNPLSGSRRVPCPIDPSHSVLQENLESHVKRCPLKKQAEALETQPYYTKGINAGDPDEGTVSSAAKRSAIYGLTPSEFYDLVNKIKLVHSTSVVALRDSFMVPEACEKWLNRQVDRRVPFQEKHVVQQASILGNMEAFGILRRDGLDREEHKVPAIVEFGAGRGYLTQMLADCYRITKVFLVERRSYKLKADRSLRQNQSIVLERLRIDNRKFLSNLGITKEEFHAMTWFSSWAVDGDHSSEHPCMEDEEKHHMQASDLKDFDLNDGGIEKIIRSISVGDRAVLGFMCKEIIDMGRLLWLREHGCNAELINYVPSNISPENHLLIAKFH
ncbi:tRNA:m(4)X modification enzyme TRM13 isoform X11 [Typha latifolia]|uniref:tRNA:m(4)X modification enzyme TRM13 isoform X11 n=1 Tax=Typha latifolia TaxID=4733 RepID=UPI003C2C2E44